MSFRKYFAFLILSSFVLINFPSTAQTSTADFSALENFWNITGKLQKNETPYEQEWIDMFNCIGYKSLRNDEGIRSNIELVFTPGRKSELDSALMSAGYWWKRDLLHLISVKEKQEVLKLYSKEIDIDKILMQSLELAETYLPKGITKLHEPPPVMFVIFSPDARAMGGNIIFDLKFTMDIGENLLTQTLAHEAHHYYCNFIPSELNPPSEESSYDPIYSTLRQLQLEGVADLIDKEDYILYQKNDTAGSFVKMWNEAQQQQSVKMKILDSMLCVMAVDTTGMYETGVTAFRMFPVNCHPNGNYMAKLILKHFGAESIIKSMKNPFQFFRLYKDACIVEGNEYVLSDNAMAYLDDLEKIFLIPDIK
ncbi:MAG TPA: hypothetical protein PKC58_14435 [Ignavibacteria bacterium]|nr:hypothetical protein [Ignavibacteria bacterium]